MSGNPLYLSEPDFQKPLFKLSKGQLKQLYECLFDIYGRLGATEVIDELVREIVVHAAYRKGDADFGSAHRGREEESLQGLWILESTWKKWRDEKRKKTGCLQERARDMEKAVLWLRETRETDQIPEASGRGGKWMIDCYLTSVPLQDEWLREYLAGNPKFKDFFVAFASPPGPADAVNYFLDEAAEGVRFIHFHTLSGERWILSDSDTGRVILNLNNPAVLLAVVGRVLKLIRRGFFWINLGDVPSGWCNREKGEGHKGYSGILDVLEMVLLLTSPEVGLQLSFSHQVCLFPGNSGAMHSLFKLVREPDLVYALLGSVMNGEAEILNRWLNNRPFLEKNICRLNMIRDKQTFYLERGPDFMSEEERERLGEWLVSRGGQAGSLIEEGNPSQKKVLLFEWGRLFDAQEESVFAVCCAVAMSLSGVPGWSADLFFSGETGGGLSKLLNARSTCAGFDPRMPEKVLNIHPNVFALLRGKTDGDMVFCMINLSRRFLSVRFDGSEIPLPEGKWRDLLSGAAFMHPGKIQMKIEPFQICWYIITDPENEDAE